MFFCNCKTDEVEDKGGTASVEISSTLPESWVGLHNNADGRVEDMALVMRESRSALSLPTKDWSLSLEIFSARVPIY